MEASDRAKLERGGIMRVKGQVLEMAGGALCILCWIPVLVAWRNYYHGLALIHRRTLGMSVGGVCRNAVGFLLAWAACAPGLLNHGTTAGILACGFLVDAGAVALSTRGWRRARLSK